MEAERIVIPNFPEYTIDKYGNILNTKRNKFIKIYNAPRGYKKVILYNKNGRYIVSLHRLLCTVFKPIENMENMTVDHIDGHCENNSLDNLEWVSLKENIKRYWNKRKGFYNFTLDKPILVYYLKEKKEVRYNTVIEASKDLKLHRYEIARRLCCKFNHIFKDYTMVKWADDLRPFSVPENIEKGRLDSEHAIVLKAYNHITKENKEFNSLQSAAEYTGLSISLLSTLLAGKESLIIHGWEFIRKTSDKDFSRLTLQELISHKYGKYTIFCIRDDVTKIKVFKNLESAAKFLNIKRTTLHYKLNYVINKPELLVISGWKVTMAASLTDEEASALL